MTPTKFVATVLVSFSLHAQLVAQETREPKTTESVPKPADDNFLAWPADADRVVCHVGGKDYSLRAVLSHIAERHYPPMLRLMETPAGISYLRSPRIAEWVRTFTDIKTLELEAASRGIDYEQVKETLGEALRRDFQVWLNDYTSRREREGAPIEFTQERVNLLLTDYQRDEGMRSEATGWLDVLIPTIAPDQNGDVREFYESHPEYFGGVLTIAQILVENRDPRTMQLLGEKQRQAAWAKVADIQSRLVEDGSNFEEVARLLSDDRRSARNGGRLDGVRRIDPRLPAILCRTAWGLKDGEVSAPFESQYGIHIVKRVSYRHLYYIVYNDKIAAEVAETMRRVQQEDLLFRARAKFNATLRY
ncbi:MAG: peptidylprolyl isomerase [Planctomycetota bacterium]